MASECGDGDRSADGGTAGLPRAGAPTPTPAGSAGAVPPWDEATPAPEAAPAAARSDGWFREIAEQTGDVFYAIRTYPDFAIEFVSDSVSRWGGYSAADYIADPGLLGKILDPRDSDRVAAAFRMEPGQDVEWEFRWLHRDGRPVWTQNWGRRRVREDGSIVLEGTAHDITPLRLAQQQAQESEERLRLVLDNVGDAILQFDRKGTLLWASPSLATVLGWEPEQVIGQQLALTCPEDREETEAIFRAAVRERASDVRHRSRTARGDGRVIWVDNTARLLWDDEGTFTGVICAIRDVTDQVEAQEALAASQEHFRLLAEQSSDFTLRTVRGFVVDWVSPSVSRVLGWRPDEIVGHSGFDFFHPNDIEPTRETAAKMATGASASGRLRLRCADGSFKWVSQVATPVFDDRGKLVARISGFQDVDAQVRAEHALARSERRFRLAMEFAPTGMAVIDLDRTFVEVNPALCRMLGRDEAWLLEHRVSDVLDTDDDDATDVRMREEVLSGRVESASNHHRMLTADGDTVWAEHSVGLLRDEDGTPLSYVSQFLDVTAAHQAQERLRFLAGHDALTSLANRHQLLARLSRILAHAPGAGSRIAVLFVDLDNFKPINDTHGHAAGDAVLVEFAHRLTATVRGDDVVARLGGDEFIVALPGIRRLDDAQNIAAKIHEALAIPFKVGEAAIRTTVSIGLTLARQGEDPDEVLRRADRALYRAKGSGRNRTVAVADTDTDTDPNTDTEPADGADVDVEQAADVAESPAEVAAE